jgi:hypothetical protein
MELVEKAIGELRERGWVRGELMDDFGRVCLLGALQVAQTTVNCTQQNEVVLEAYRILLERYGYDKFDSVEDWNDNYADSVDDVIELLKLAGERVDLAAERSGLSCS